MKMKPQKIVISLTFDGSNGKREVFWSTQEWFTGFDGYWDGFRNQLNYLFNDTLMNMHGNYLSNKLLEGLAISVELDNTPSEVSVQSILSNKEIVHQQLCQLTVEVKNNIGRFLAQHTLLVLAKQVSEVYKAITRCQSEQPLIPSDD